MSTVAEPLEKKKERVLEANALLSQLDEVTQKAVYIATTMFLAAKDTREDEKEGEKHSGN